MHLVWEYQVSYVFLLRCLPSDVPSDGEDSNFVSFEDVRSSQVRFTARLLIGPLKNWRAVKALHCLELRVDLLNFVEKVDTFKHIDFARIHQVS